jgi:hypothetical protein
LQILVAMATKDWPKKHTRKMPLTLHENTFFDRAPEHITIKERASNDYFGFGGFAWWRCRANGGATHREGAQGSEEEAVSGIQTRPALH